MLLSVTVPLSERLCRKTSLSALALSLYKRQLGGSISNKHLFMCVSLPAAVAVSTSLHKRHQQRCLCREPAVVALVAVSKSVYFGTCECPCQQQSLCLFASGASASEPAAVAVPLFCASEPAAVPLCISASASSSGVPVPAAAVAVPLFCASEPAAVPLCLSATATASSSGVPVPAATVAVVPAAAVAGRRRRRWR